MGSKIRIIAKMPAGMESRLSFGSDVYDIQTEDLGAGKSKIVTRIFRGGEVVHVVTSDYTHPGGNTGLDKLIEDHHKTVIEQFFQERPRLKSKPQYAAELNRVFSKNDQRGALEVVREALLAFPADPFFRSHCGFLVASVEKNHREGIKMCEEAITLLRKSLPDDLEFFYPLFYLNLGKALLSAARKKQAMGAFREGLKYNPRDPDLLSEMKRFGARKDPVFSFLERANPINKFFGKIRHRLQT